MNRPLPKRSFVISYDEAEQKFMVFSLKDSDIEPLKEQTVVSDWPLSSIGHEIGEEAVRRLGMTAFDILSIYHPTLKPLVKLKLARPELPEDEDGPLPES
ncbi:hypothetical protein [Paraburkholderia caballeronis]|uniref:hypothetical protein n=1 Tax=Paraburkholderia caballeronis TaxID=416943 RepID=UPI001064F7AE|nr:hypothetical protein [Paraburkholderia caballeronis]TDV18305.1 hypothetical protein C7408_10360 [Paraburkholderia caballeronis]TDV20157.1 hypothetical protein C7406_103381 [Paraburkholderia caballeronis]TDV28374.1 hypothetical protein C7404_103381 [Paraburkholderia caballeronis]TDV36936.1 hypothetical protein C7405_10361 [Paraburkholderia caballeronis]